MGSNYWKNWKENWSLERPTTINRWEGHSHQIFSCKSLLYFCHSSPSIKGSLIKSTRSKGNSYGVVAWTKKTLFGGMHIVELPKSLGGLALGNLYHRNIVILFKWVCEILQQYFLSLEAVDPGKIRIPCKSQYQWYLASPCGWALERNLKLLYSSSTSKSSGWKRIEEERGWWLVHFFLAWCLVRLYTSKGPILATIQGWSGLGLEFLVV